MTDLCKHCGKPESEHHAFEAVERPVGCVCDPALWRTELPIPPVCGEYVSFDDDDACRHCEHDRACHATKD